uniref:Uncharacterized protein n=1 Tax=Neogobius melanostomus TaxID=47308 RepID=A0A8C6UG57_9GOBI
MEVAGYYDEGSFAFHGRDSIITPISGSHWRVGDSMTELGFEERERAIDFGAYLDSALHYPAGHTGAGTGGHLPRLFGREQNQKSGRFAKL